MDELAAHCGISKKTLYQHYADKETLVDTILVQMISRSEEQCLMFREKSQNAVHEIFLSLDMLREMFHGVNPVMLYDLHKYHQTSYKKLAVHKEEFLKNHIRQNLQRGIEEGLFRSDINVEIITLLHLYNITIAFEQEWYPRQQFSLLEMQQEMMLHYVHGITTSKGAKLIEKYKQNSIKTT